MNTTLRPTDREDIARRLLRSSAKASYDPLTTIDWERPVDPDRYAIAPHRVSLYGTELWDQLTEAQRKELSRQEVASAACVGIWFETILMQMLIRHAYDRDPTTSHVQYSYTEIGDECRHSVMFARFVTKLGAPYYPLDRVGRLLGRWFKTTSNGPLTFSAALFVEELLDQMQREMMADEQLEPLTRAVADSVGVPVIASVGVGNLDHLVDGIRNGHATAVLAASIFHFGEFTIREAKDHMVRSGLPMRLDP